MISRQITRPAIIISWIAAVSCADIASSQRFGAERGTPVGSEFRVNRISTGDQVAPAVAAGLVDAATSDSASAARTVIWIRFIIVSIG